MKRSQQSLEYRDKIYEQFSRIGKAVSSPKRLELLDILAQGENTVEKLAKMINQSVANTSQHLQVLRNAHLVESRKKGLYAHYSLADRQVADFYLALRNLAESQLSEVRYNTEDYLGQLGLSKDDDDEIDEIIERVQRGEATLIDLRSREEYRQGHLPGAISIPASELEDHLEELKEMGDLVAYCRGPYCVLNMQAVELMRRHGIRVVRLSIGTLEWLTRGYNLEESNTTENI